MQIPYATKRSEIIAFLGKNARILNDVEEPIHIIMERLTSKTMDAFVEFHTMDDAMNACHRHKAGLDRGRPSRLGDRTVDVELSSQKDLMASLFPYARGLKWDGPVPVIDRRSETEPWANFQGFVTNEEMIMLVKHAEVPQHVRPPL